MKRIDTTTALADKHGTGRNGFTYGTPGVTAETEVDDTWLDAVQEEVANTVELGGTALDSANPFQLATAVHGSLRDVLGDDRGFVASGLVITNPVAGLDVVVSAGVFYVDGQRYTVDPSADTLTLANNDTRYIYIGPHATDPRGHAFIDRSSLAANYDEALVGVVTTSGGVVTDIVVASAQTSAGSRWHTGQVVARALVPDGPSANLGFATAFLGHTTGRWNNLYVQNVTLGEDSGGVGDNTRNEETHEIVRQSVSGAGTDSHILIGATGYANGDMATIEVKVAGRRTDSVAGYSAHMTIGARHTAGAWAFNGPVSVLHEDGDGGGVRDLRPIIDGSDRVTLLMDIDNAEDWEFTTKVAVLWNTGV